MLNNYAKINLWYVSGGFMRKNREINFELMRIVSMLLIVTCHVIDSGKLISNCTNDTLIIVFEIIMFLTRVHVCSFMLLTGYFQSNSKFKLKKLIMMFLQVFFYLILFFLIALKMGLVSDLHLIDIIKLVLPSSISEYWFVSAYVITYIFSDYINKFINRITRKEHKNIIILGFVVLCILPYLSGLRFLNNDGFNFFHFIYLYIIGAYLRRFPLKKTYHFRRMNKNLYIMFMFLLFISMFMLNYFIILFSSRIRGANSIFTYISNNILVVKYCYSNPFTVIQSIAYFEIFNCIRIKNRLISYISKNVLGVYLFHENFYVKKVLYKYLKIDTGMYYSYKKFVYFIVAIIVIFVIGITIEIIRRFIEKSVIMLIKRIKKNYNKNNTLDIAKTEL